MLNDDFMKRSKAHHAQQKIPSSLLSQIGLKPSQGEYILS